MTASLIQSAVLLSLSLALAILGCKTPEVRRQDIDLQQLIERGEYAAAVSIGDRLLPQIEARNESEAIVRVGLRLAYAKWRAGDIGGAVAVCERILPTAEAQFKNDYRPAQVVELLANIKAEVNALDDAEQLFRRAIALREQLPRGMDPKLNGALKGLGDVFVRRGDYRQAESYLQRVLEAQESTPSVARVDLANTMIRLADVLNRTGDLEKAQDLADRSVEIFTKEKGADHPDTAEAVQVLVLIAESKGDYRTSAHHAERVLAVFEKRLGVNHPSTAMARQNLALLYAYLNRLTDAVAMYEQSVSALEQAFGPNHPDLGVALLNLGGRQASLGREADAERSYRRAARIFESSVGPDHDYTAMISYLLAELYQSQGFYPESIDLSRRALAVYERSLGANNRRVVQALLGLAIPLGESGRYSEAQETFGRALEMARKIPDGGTLEMSVLDSFAALRMRRGEYVSAREMAGRALSIAEKKSGKRDLSVGRLRLLSAKIDEGLGHFERAEDGLRDWLAIADELLDDSYFESAEAEFRLGALAWRRGSLDEALARFEGGLTREERRVGRTLGVLPERRQRQLMGNLRNGVDAIISFQVANASLLRASTPLAYRAVLSRKGRTLEVAADQWRQARREATAEQGDLLQKLRDVRSQIAALAYADNGEPAADRASRMASLDQDRTRLEDTLVERLPLPRAAPVSIEQVAAQIPEDGVLVDIVRYRRHSPKSLGTSRGGSMRYAAYVLSKGMELHWRDLGPAGRIDQAVSALRESMSRPEDADFSARSRMLDQLVFEPISRFFNNKTHVLISLDGTLNLVPFAALLDADGHFRVERFLFTYLDSSRDLVRLAGLPHADRSAVVIGAPDFSRASSDTKASDVSGLTAARGAEGESELLLDEALQGRRRSGSFKRGVYSPLPAAAKELESIASLLGVPAVVGASAQESAVKRAERPRVLHIATHAFFLDGESSSGANNPMVSSTETVRENPLLRSGLIFAGADGLSSGAEDGVLTALEVATLDLTGTELVVLSACDTGVGEIRSSDGIYGLRRAFALAGARSELMSLWKVNDEATRLLMTEYYRRLLRRESRSEALRQVQMSLLNNPATSSPYFWAAFVLVGDWRSLPSPTERSAPTPTAP